VLTFATLSPAKQLHKREKADRQAFSTAETILVTVGADIKALENQQVQWTTQAELELLANP